MFKRTAIAAAATTCVLVSGAAIAQEAQRVEITGSSIKRIAAEGALPVQTVSQEEIRKSGATSVSDLMQLLPVMQGFTSIGDSVGGTGGGITTASIHDLGEQYTLVLLNGRRVAPADSGTTIDLNSIPLSAIDRVEILTDGASAIYGADAIAGVVNFILKQGEAPFTVDVRVSRPEKRGGEQTNLSLSKGFGDVERDGFSFFGAISYDKTKTLKGSQRSFAKTGIISGTRGGQTFDFFNGSSRSVPPNVDVRYNDPASPSTSSGNSVTSFNPYLMANGSCAPVHVKIGNQCFYDYTSEVEIQPEIERKAVYGSGKLKLGTTGWTAFGDLALTDVSTVAAIASYPAEFGLATSHPYFTKYVQPYLTSAQLATMTSVNVKYRLSDLGNRTYDYNTKAAHMVAGLEGKAGVWDITTAFTYSRQKQNENYVRGFPLADPFQAGIDGQLFDPFLYTVGQMPADQVAALRSTQYTGNYKKTKIDMLGLEVNAQRELFKMTGGSSIVSLGADFRKIGYAEDPNPAVSNAQILFDDPQPTFDLSRKSWGIFSEMLFPFTKTIEGTAAIRYDSISGVKDHVTGATIGNTETAGTFKLGARWQASPQMLFRASYGTGFRSATMKEIAQPRVDFGVTSGSYDCPFNASYDPLGYIAAGYVCDNKLQKEVFQQGNGDLKPEKSSQWNVGWVWQPTNEISTGLNYWSVDIKDAVEAVSEQLILDNPAQYLDLYTTKFKSSNGLTYVAILDTSINIGKRQARGIDWDISYRKRFPGGEFLGTLAGTHLIKSRYTVPGTSNQWTSSLNKFGVDDKVAFRNIIRASGTVKLGTWEHTLALNYRNGYTDQRYTEEDCVFLDAAGQCTAGALKVPKYYTFDWQTRWGATKNLSLTFGIQNLFDRDPPLSLRTNGAGHQLGYDPRYASALGRTFYLSGQFQF